MVWLLGIVLKGFFLFAFYLSCAFLRVATQKWMPNGVVKQIMLTEFHVALRYLFLLPGRMIRLIRQ